MMIIDSDDVMIPVLTWYWWWLMIVIVIGAGRCNCYARWCNSDVLLSITEVMQVFAVLMMMPLYARTWVWWLLFCCIDGDVVDDIYCCHLHHALMTFYVLPPLPPCSLVVCILYCLPVTTFCYDLLIYATIIHYVDCCGDAIRVLMMMVIIYYHFVDTIPFKIDVVIVVDTVDDRHWLYSGIDCSLRDTYSGVITLCSDDDDTLLMICRVVLIR